MTPNSVGFICHTDVTNGYDMVTVECIESKKSDGQTNKQTNEDKKTIVAVDYNKTSSVCQLYLIFLHYNTEKSLWNTYWHRTRCNFNVTVH